MNKSNLIGSLILGTIICFSCKETQPIHPILKVSLNDRTTSIFDLFQRVEIIPLTTTQESLFAYTDNIKIYNDTIFLFDRTLHALYIFGPNGEFINKIRKVGRGTGEYTMAADFTVNPANRTIRILNPMGEIFDYDFGGNFFRKIRLPKPPRNYRSIELLDSIHYITWSSVYEKELGGVNILDNKQNEIIHSLFPYSTLWGSLRYGSVFDKYNGTLYYHESFSEKVYSISADGQRVAYEWDTGVYLDSRKPKIPIEETPAAQQKMFEEFQNGEIPFFFGPQFQSRKYYSTILTFSNPVVRKSLFYDKATGENWLFATTSEGIALDLKWMGDRYALGILHHVDRERFKNIVSKSDAALLENMKEDDNSWLVKYIMKDDSNH